MLKNKMSMIILSCDKYDDLWDLHISLLKKNWNSNLIDVYIVTENNVHKKKFENVNIVSTGSNLNYSDRLIYALNLIKTECVLLTLDDYFPINSIDTNRIENLVNFMYDEKFDYIRLFRTPNSYNKIKDKLFLIDLYSKYDSNYQINLYAGIWKVSFLKQIVSPGLNAWELETSLTKKARGYDCKCALSKGKEFETLDVIRKGKLLHRAKRYLKKNNLTLSDRQTVPYFEEIRISFFTFLKSILPQSIINFGKRILNKIGIKFYS